MANLAIGWLCGFAMGGGFLAVVLLVFFRGPFDADEEEEPNRG